MRLEIKPEFINSIITIKFPTLGKITFNAGNEEPKNYQHFYDLGFSDYFDVINEPIRVESQETKQNK